MVCLQRLLLAVRPALPPRPHSSQTRAVFCRSHSLGSLPHRRLLPMLSSIFTELRPAMSQAELLTTFPAWLVGVPASWFLSPHLPHSRSPSPLPGSPAADSPRLLHVPPGSSPCSPDWFPCSWPPLPAPPLPLLSSPLLFPQMTLLLRILHSPRRFLHSLIPGLPQVRTSPRCSPIILLEWKPPVLLSAFSALLR